MVSTEKDIADGPHPNLHEVWPQVRALGKYNNQNNVWQAFFEGISRSRRSIPIPASRQALPFYTRRLKLIEMPGGIDRRLPWYYFNCERFHLRRLTDAKS
jgi:hypothetical protein